MKRKKTIKAITMIELGLAGVLFVVLALLVFWYTDGLSSYSPKVVTYQCIGKEKMEFTEDAKFQEKDGRVKVTDNEMINDVDDNPILIKDSRDMILSKNMGLMVPVESLAIKRVNRFTKVTENNGIITYEADKKRGRSIGGFLFDGKDIYVFLENTVVNIGNNKINLPPLSYVRVRYNQSVEYYNSETKESDTTGIYNVDVISESESGFKIDMGKDVLYVNDAEILIFSGIDELKVLEME